MAARTVFLLCSLNRWNQAWASPAQQQRLMAVSLKGYQFTLTHLMSNGTQIEYPIAGRAQCPSGCMPTFMTNSANGVVVPETSQWSRSLVTLHRCICAKKDRHGVNIITPPVIIAINLKTFSLLTLASLSKSIYNSVAVSSYTTSFDQQRQAIIVVGPHLLVNSSDTFGPSVERVVAIDLAPPHKVQFVTDTMYQCNPQGFPGYPPNNCSQGTYDSPFLGSGSVLPISSANSTSGSVYAVLVAEQGWVPPSPGKPSKQRMRLVGFEIPKSANTATTVSGHLRHPPVAATTLFNHSIDIGFWTLANDRDGGLIGLGPCCDPDTIPSCPALCAGTTPETPRMILSAWPSAELSDPKGQALILGVFDIDEMGLGFSDGAGGDFDPIAQVYSHLMLGGKGQRGLRLVQFNTRTGTATIETVEGEFDLLRYV